MRNWKRCEKGDGKGRLKSVAWALPTNQTQNFRRPLLAVIIVGKAHATMYSDEAKGRLRTGRAIFAETSAVIPIFVEMKVVKNWHDQPYGIIMPNIVSFY